MADNLIQMLEGLRGLGVVTNEGWDDWSAPPAMPGEDYYTPPADYVTLDDGNSTFDWTMPNEVPLKPGWSEVEDPGTTPTGTTTTGQSTPKSKAQSAIPWKMALGAVAVAAAAWWAFGDK